MDVVRDKEGAGSDLDSCLIFKSKTKRRSLPLEILLPNLHLKVKLENHHKINVLQSADPDNKDKHHKTGSHEKQSKNKKNWPTVESLSRHANFRPLGKFLYFLY